MTRISQREYYDEIDNEHRIHDVIHRKKYKDNFIFLYNYFFRDQLAKWITVGIMQEKLCIPDRQAVHQVLYALKVLNLLEPTNKPGTNKTYYFPINNQWWKKFMEEVQNGSRRKN